MSNTVQSPLSCVKGWDVVTLGQICDLVQSQTQPTQGGTRYYLGLEHLRSVVPLLKGSGLESDVSSAKSAFRRGDVLVGKLRPYLRKSYRATQDGICSTDILVLRARDSCSPDFLCFLTLLESFVQHAIATTSGVNHPRTSWGALRDFVLCLPPLTEQRQIVALIAAVLNSIVLQEQLRALTRELSHALVSKLFSEGFRRAPTRESEVGHVPKTWEVTPLANLFSDVPKNGLYAPASKYGDGTPILRINDFGNDGDIVVGASNRVRISSSDSHVYRLREDDLVINRVNSLSHLGKTALVGSLTEPMVYESNMMRFSVDHAKVNPRFVFRVINSALVRRQIIAGASRAVAQSSINQGTVGRLLIPVPPRDEQDEIVACLDSIDQKARLHDAKLAALSDLFRTLLHQLMTGQLRVDQLDLSALPGG